MIITILGPDGTGKTSLREIVSPMLQEKYPQIKIKHYERRIGWFTSIWKFAGKQEKISDPLIVKEQKIKRMHPVKSLVIIFYYTFEFLVFKVSTWMSFGTERNNIHFFARYWYDYYFGYAHNRVPETLMRVLELAIPRPHLILYIDRPADHIRRDKPELPLEEIHRQQRAITGSRIARFKQFRRIQATDDLQSTAALVFSEICELMDQRVGAERATL